VANYTICVPDIGGAEGAEVVELLVGVGDQIEVEQSLIVLESDKASMEIPASHAGIVSELKMALGDELSEGDAILVIELADGEAVATVQEETPSVTAEESAVVAVDNAAVNDQPADTSGSDEVREIVIAVPDIGTDGDVEVVEIPVAVGDVLEEGDSIVVLESDKASMEVPSTTGGEVLALLVEEGALVKEGSSLVRIRTSGSVEAAGAASEAPVPAPAPAPMAPRQPVEAAQSADANDSSSLYVGPAVRKLAREFGVDLVKVKGSGPKGRIIKEDVQAYVATRLSEPTAGSVVTGSGIPSVADIDFSKFGAIRREDRSRIEKVTAANMSKSWLNVPHVTQFDDADITDMEAFRKSLKAEAERRGSKLSPLPYIIKAVALALNENPKIKSSLAEQGEALIYKDYCHIGMAVDTPNGLVVPVIRDADKKSIWVLSDEIRDLAAKAKDKKLRPDEMQGAVFTISSLGNIGGRGFTPIVNTPEVGILGVSKASTQPVWDGEAFQPRVMLPVALSYDHRVVNGGDAGRFLTYLVSLLSDIRQLAMS
jgi:pyruvate dehydrogenase E2 component (dihydrolipoamide acetyltransferase)